VRRAALAGVATRRMARSKTGFPEGFGPISGWRLASWTTQHRAAQGGQLSSAASVRITIQLHPDSGGLSGP
jgi:hypothetical protein